MKIWLLVLGLSFLFLAILLIVIGVVMIMMAKKKGAAVAPRPAARPPAPAPLATPTVAPPPPMPQALPPQSRPIVAPPPPLVPAALDLFEPIPHVPPAPEPAPRPASPPPPPSPLFDREISPGVTQAIPLPDNDSTVLASVPLNERGMLVATTGRLAGQQFDLGPAGVVIGREPSVAQVVIEDPRVSKKHVWVGERDGVVMAVDRGSTNGTYLNTMDSQRITTVTLQSGDILIISDDVARFTFQR